MFATNQSQPNNSEANVMSSVLPNEKPQDFVTKCSDGRIDISAELYRKLVAQGSSFPTNVVSECDVIFTNIIQKQPNILDESKMLRLRYILNTYLSECVHIYLDIGNCLSTQMYQIERKYKCSYSGYDDMKFGDYLNTKEYKEIINYNHLTQPKGLLSGLLDSAINLIVELLHAENNLINGLLGQVLGLKGCIQSVIGVVDTIVRGVYLSIENLFIEDLGEYFGEVNCKAIDHHFMNRTCLIMNDCLEETVKVFFNESVHHVYRCMHMKYLRLEQMSLHTVMNLY